MITVYEYACLSGHVYNPHLKIYGGLHIGEAVANKLPSDASGFYIILDVDSFVVPHNGFYAALYLKFWEGELEDAVIAFRGTVPDYLSNDLVDLLSWFSSALGTGEADRVPFFFKEASVFVEKAYDYLDDNFPNFLRLSWHLSYTGHSLGGALAQMMTLRKRYPHQSVVFNSPGCTEMAGPAYEERRHKVLSINARWGIINKIGLPVGPMIPIDIPEEEEKAKALIKGFGEGFYHFSLQLDHTSDNVRYLTPPLASILHQFGYAARIGAYDESLANLAQESSVRRHVKKNMKVLPGIPIYFLQPMLFQS